MGVECSIEGRSSSSNEYRGSFCVSFVVPWLGTLLTGIVVSRGSNYTSDFIQRLQNPDIGEIVLEDVIGVADAGGKAEIQTSGVPPNAR